jgi:hypothetical protein
MTSEEKTDAVATTEEKTDAVAVWKPKEFKGNDLLPLDAATDLTVEGIPELIGRENVDPDDLIVPTLALLHGTSDAVTDGVEGAVPGRFMHTGSEEVLDEGHLRVIIVHHHKGNALFPKEDERYKDLETCISPDQVEGTVYGACEECRKCLDWDDENNKPPLGAQVHHFVAMTSLGPVIIRFSRSSYKAANKWLSAWTSTKKYMWTHPTVIRVVQGTKTMATGDPKKYFMLQMAWQTTEKVPAELQLAAYELYKNVRDKHESGHLKSTDEEASGDGDFDIDP